MISCGGGIVVIPEVRELLKKEKYVIWIRRDLNDIEKDFYKRGNDPGYINSLKEDYELRREFYEEISSHTFNIPKFTFFNDSIGEKEYWGKLEKTFKRFIKSLLNKENRN